MDSDIPIDIHYNKLLDWLMSRRHCQQTWQAAALTIREKINNAIQDMPPNDEITALLSGTYINYFHCLRIVDLLKDTESSTKNIFGRYSSQRMKDWQEIVKLYEKNCVYLAEAAQLLTRNVNYEVPSLKKQISKSQQQQQDTIRKESDYSSQATELKSQYNTQCKNMGIEGKRLKRELVDLVKDLPSVYNRIGSAAVNLRTAIDYYSAFLQFTMKQPEIGTECVSLLKYMSDKGNVTMYEHRTGAAPTSVVERTLDFLLEDEEDDVADESKTDEIDWGAVDFSTDGGEAADTIDFGDTATDGAVDGIDWGTADISIEVVDDSSGQVGETNDTGVARGDDAMSLLDHNDTRNAFINELLELEAFLTQRIQELKVDDLLTSNQFQSAPMKLHVGEDQLRAMVAEVSAILEQLTNQRMQELILIRSSPRYVHRLAASMKKKLEDAEKAMASSRLMVLRRSEALEEQKQTEPKLELIRKKTLQLKQQIENEISKKYQNRRVNIMGEINSM